MCPMGEPGAIVALFFSSSTRACGRWVGDCKKDGVVFCVAANYEAKDRVSMLKNYFDYQKGLSCESLIEKSTLKSYCVTLRA